MTTTVLTQNGVDDSFLKNVLAEMAREWSRGNLLQLVGPADSQIENIAEGRAAVMIFNTHAKSQPGEHWVAAFADDRTNKVWLFNSLPLPGKIFPHQVTDKFRAMNKELIFENHEPMQLLQDPLLPLCGFYCLAWLLCHIKNEKLELCTNNWTLNDAIVVTKVWPYVEKLYA